jgi:hypothetical protein
VAFLLIFRGENSDAEPEEGPFFASKNFGCFFDFRGQKLPRVTSGHTSVAALSKIAQVIKQKPPGAVSGGFKLGAGVGFEPTTFRL